MFEKIDQRPMHQKRQHNKNYVSISVSVKNFLFLKERALKYKIKL